MSFPPWNTSIWRITAVGRIENCFNELKRKRESAFVAYITAGDPSVEATVDFVLEFERRGVDIVELGIPFSDPVADGLVNQEAAMRALASGTTVETILDSVRTIRGKSSIPMIFFTYYNPLLAYGLERFVADAAESGIDGALVLDLPPEEAGDYKKLMDEKGLCTVFLVSPVTPENRIECIAQYATGFVYYVSHLGVTGERDRVSLDISERLALVRRHTDIPVVAGFGVSTPAQARETAGYADGVVVGSAIVKRIAESGASPEAMADIGSFVETLTKPLHGG